MTRRVRREYTGSITEPSLAEHLVQADRTQSYAKIEPFQESNDTSVE